MTRVELGKPEVNVEQQAAALFTQASSEYPACLFGGAISVALAVREQAQLDTAQLMRVAQSTNSVWEKVARAANTRHLQSGLNSSTVPAITSERAREMAFDFFRLADDLNNVSTRDLRQFLENNYPSYLAERRASPSKNERDEVQMKYVNKLRSLAGLTPAVSAAEQQQKDFYNAMMGDRGYE